MDENAEIREGVKNVNLQIENLFFSFSADKLPHQTCHKLTWTTPRRKAKKKMQRGASEKKKKAVAVVEPNKGGEAEVEAEAQPKQVIASVA